MYIVNIYLFIYISLTSHYYWHRESYPWLEPSLAPTSLSRRKAPLPLWWGIEKRANFENIFVYFNLKNINLIFLSNAIFSFTMNFNINVPLLYILFERTSVCVSMRSSKCLNYSPLLLTHTHTHIHTHLFNISQTFI